MRDWRLTQANPLALRLCADVRFGPTDYADDQIWELSLAGGDPPALSLHTTYGLRAREMRIFPAFREGDSLALDPDSFAAPPVVQRFAVNNLQLAFRPLPDLQVHADYWCPDSHTVAGQFILSNDSRAARSLRFDLGAELRPLPGGDILAPAHAAGIHFLKGCTGTPGLHPALLLDGGLPPEASAWPALTRSLELAPGETATLRWAHCARPGWEAGLAAAQGWLASGWPIHFQRLKHLAADVPVIETGDPDWDATLAFSYKVALQSYVGPTQHLPYPSFVFARTPNKGYSPGGDGSDHSWMWNGQVATEAYVSLPQIVQAAPDLAKGIIRNYIAVQDPSGFIDWKPGLAGQRERALCIPLLASLAWCLYEYTEDRDFIAEVYGPLSRFVQLWFSERYDRDQDGTPEWSHTVQSAFDDCPSFVRWQSWGQAADISLAESPDLTAYLYRELKALIKMAHTLDRDEDTPPLAARVEILRLAADGMWRDDTACYHYVDIETHESPPGFEFSTAAASGGPVIIPVARKFSQLARVLVRVQGPKDAEPGQVSVTIRGRGRRGRHRVEELPARRMSWYWGLGSVTSDKVYAEIEAVEVRGVPAGWQVFAGTVDYTRLDQTLLLPLWAGLARGDRRDALVGRTLTDPQRFWRPYGIPNCSAQDPAYAPDNVNGSGGVWMMWNTMIGEGLADNGYPALAAELIRRIMEGIIHSLKTDKSFHEAYNCDKLEGLRERDYLWGVAPVHLFLRTLGLRIVSERKVWLRGPNPFPWPVTVKWRGVSVTKAAGQTTVQFPSGRNVTLESDVEQFVADVD
jgi:hypothetical protein